MTRVVEVQAAKTDLSALLSEVEAGEEVVIARGAQPIAKLVPLAAAGPRELGFVSWTVPDSFFADLSDDELVQWGS